MASESASVPREKLHKQILSDVRDWQRTKDTRQFAGKVISHLDPEIASRISLSLVEEESTQQLVRAIDRGSESAVADVMADLLITPSIRWTLIFRLHNLRIDPGESINFGTLEVFGMDGSCVDGIAENLKSATDDSATLHRYFDESTCCSIKLERHPRDTDAAITEALGQARRRIAVLRLGLRCASDAIDDPPIVAVDAGCVLFQKGEEGMWSLQELPGLDTVELDADSRVAISQFYSDKLNMDVGLGPDRSAKERSVGKTPLNVLLSEVRLLMGIAEASSTPLSKFLRYMTALERLLATQEGESSSITRRLAIRGYLLYSSARIPGRIARTDSVSPRDIVRLYNLRSVSHHQGNQHIDWDDVEILRSICISSFFMSKEILEIGEATDVDGFSSLLCFCEELILACGCVNSAAALGRRYLELLRKETKASLLEKACGLLTRLGFLDRQCMQLSESGGILYAYLVGRKPT